MLAMEVSLSGGERPQQRDLARIALRFQRGARAAAERRIALLEEVLEEFEAEIAEPTTPRPIRRQKRVKRSY